jgi:hypothetical protein
VTTELITKASLPEGENMGKMLVSTYRYHKLEELLANVLIANASVHPKQAERHLKQSIFVAESIGGCCEIQ